MDTEGQINFRLRWSFRKRTNGKFLIETRLNVKFGYIEITSTSPILQISSFGNEKAQMILSNQACFSANT
jgi:hypothetical protein